MKLLLTSCDFYSEEIKKEFLKLVEDCKITRLRDNEHVIVVN